jgi:hypothetical protein
VIDIPPEWEERLRHVPPEHREQAIRYLIEEQEFFRMCRERGIEFVVRDGQLKTRKRPRRQSRRVGKVGYIWQSP